MPGIVRKLRSLRSIDAGLAAEVRGALVGTLYASLTSLALGAISGTVIAATIALHAADAWITACAWAIGIVSAGRVAAMILHKRSQSTDASQAGRWERIYKSGAWSYAGLLGLMGFLTIVRAQDPVLHLMASTLAIGYAAGISGRNAARPA